MEFTLLEFFFILSIVILGSFATLFTVLCFLVWAIEVIDNGGEHGKR